MKNGRLSPPETVARFRLCVLELAGRTPGRLGLAVSGGPDSLALLKLAAEAFPGEVQAATVNHGLRVASASEAAMVAQICAQLGVPHRILVPGWTSPPTANVQALARTARYHALAAWAAGSGVTLLATAHHLDDQAETVLMRLARGAGLGGLSGIRASAALAGGIRLIRPLLSWRKDELVALVDAAGWTAVADPTNGNPDFDRTHARRLLAETDWLSPERLADAAANLAEAQEALDWAAERLLAQRCREQSPGCLLLDARDLPRELQRRLLVHAFETLGACDVPGPKLARLLDALRAGQSGTLAGLQVFSGEIWRLSPAPPRRTS